ncbi:hypothetical protein [Phocaeicola sp.]
MIKKLLFLTMFIFAAISTYADEQFKVKLDNDNHSKETIELPYCNIFLAMSEAAEDGNVHVSVEMENLDESNVLILFDRAYIEKVLKKMRPSITYDKIFGGTKGRRTIESCKGLKNVLLVPASEKYKVLDLPGKDGEVLVCRIPIYIAKYKGKSMKKLLLLEKQVIELNIEVELKPDEVYLNLNGAYDDLVKELADTVFCTNKRHRPSLEKQKEPYIAQIDSLKKEIDEVIARHNWMSTDKGYKLYDELKCKLDSINLDEREGDCGKHTYSHRCKYCSLSLQQIYHKLDDYYQKIYSSSDRKAAKSQVMNDVNLLYRCCTDATCKRHAREWRKGGEYKSKIIDRYNRIKQF